MSRQPALNIPGVVLAAMFLLALVHGVREYLMSDDADARLLLSFAFVPGRFTLLYDREGIVEAFDQFTQAAAALFFLGDGTLQWWTPVTYGFLHADWTHLGVNVLWLAAFGAPLARRFGAPRFVAFCLGATVVGALAHYVQHRYDCLPMIGASAAVSGLTAACLRFIFQPHGPLGSEDAAPDDEAYRQPALSLYSVFTNTRALSFLLLWFGVNFLFGVMSPTLGLSQGPVAWEAHVGGFVGGLLLFSIMDPPRLRSRMV